jgi:hypothetical protein
MGEARRKALAARRGGGDEPSQPRVVDSAIADDVATIECGLHHTPSDPSKLDGPIGTLWHRQS